MSTTNPTPTSENDAARLAATLRDAREAGGLSIRRVAERAGIHHAGLARIELGEQRPTPETLQRLAHVLELDEADLLALAGYRLPERLPSFPAYLRTKYRMPAEAEADLNAYFERLSQRYRIEPHHELDGGGDDAAADDSNKENQTKGDQP